MPAPLLSSFLHFGCFQKVVYDFRHDADVSKAECGRATPLHMHCRTHALFVVMVLLRLPVVQFPYCSVFLASSKKVSD